ncbi:MAG: hypothetical protein R3F59_20645 [Myxococcota bacterium]
MPDVRTLRQRVLLNVPYAAVTAALLLLHRHGARPAHRGRGVGAVARPAGAEDTALLDWIDDFAVARGWTVLRRRGAGLGPNAFVGALDAVGVATPVGRTLVLAEGLFAQLQGAAEERAILDRLQPLSDAVEAHLEARAP